MTAPVTYGEMNLAPLLHQFLEKYPRVDLDLVLTNQKLDLIEQFKGKQEQEKAYVRV